jgi:hypothetical protein
MSLITNKSIYAEFIEEKKKSLYCVECKTSRPSNFKCISTPPEKYPLTNLKVQQARGFENFKLALETKYIPLCSSCIKKRKYRGGGGGERKEDEGKKRKLYGGEEKTSSSSLVLLPPPPPLSSSSSSKESIHISSSSSSPVDYCECGMCNPPVKYDNSCSARWHLVSDIPLEGEEEKKKSGWVFEECHEIYTSQQEYLKTLKLELAQASSHKTTNSAFAGVDIINLRKRISESRRKYKEFFNL